MAHVIAVAGKGGVGKTTLCGMLIQYLCEQGKGPILAVDADANSNLNEVLGVEVETTLGDVREEIAQAELVKESPIPKGMSKQDYTEFKFDSALVEEDDYDLLVKRMEELKLNQEDYQFYLDLRKYGSTHHAGFGLGFERLVMYVTGMGNIRDVIPFPRTVGNCEL